MAPPMALEEFLRYEYCTMSNLNHSAPALLRAAAGVIFAACLPACSASAPAVPDDQELNSIELYVARGSLFGAEFEQYKLFGSELYYECGEIKGGRQYPKVQNIAAADAEKLASLRSLSYQLAQYIKSKSPALDAPGKASGFADPGQLYLSLGLNKEVTAIKTSLDSVITPSSQAAAYIERLAVSVRRMAQALQDNQPLCGNAAFYGLGAAGR